MQEPNPLKDIIHIRYLKDHPDFRKKVIQMFKEEEEKGPGPGGGGVFPKNRKPFPVANPILWENGYNAKHVEGLTNWSRSFKEMKMIFPSLIKKRYKTAREKYLLDE